MKISDIIAKQELDFLKGTKSKDEIIAIAKQRYKTNQKLIKPTEEAIPYKKPTVKEAMKDSVYTDDGIVSDIVRGTTTSGIRLMNLADGASEALGFDLVPQKYTDMGNEALEVFEDKKQKTSRKDLDKERLKELEQLDENSQKATGAWENVKAGANTMLDTATHPSEWTSQGVVEMITDPLNTLSFGAGSLAGKFGRTLLTKGLIGGTAGTVEGVTVNSASEYLIAKGQGKSKEEQEKIAYQSAGGGALAGNAFGTFGGIVSKNSTPIKIEKNKNSDILDNELLNVDTNKPLTDDEIGQKLQDAFKSYPKVSKEFKKEEAGKNKYSIHPEEKNKPNFQIIYENLPIVRSTMETLPKVVNELVEVEILEPAQAKQIENKTKKMITHKDVIHANYDSWAENISQDIIDAINAKKINDMKKVQDHSETVSQKSKALTVQLIEQGKDIATIKNTINNQFIPTKQELTITKAINNNLPIENSLSGIRLRDKIVNTIDNENAFDPGQTKQKLLSAGVSDELSNVVVQSVLNKDVQVFDDFVIEKTSNDAEVSSKAIKENITKELKDANTRNQESNRKDIPSARKSRDNESNNVQSNDTNPKPKQDRQEAITTDGTTLSEPIGRDAKSNSSDVEVSTTNRELERHTTTINNDTSNAQPGRNELVSKQDESNNGNVETKEDGFVFTPAGKEDEFGTIHTNLDRKVKLDDAGNKLTMFSNGDKRIDYKDGKEFTLHSNGSYSASATMGDGVQIGKNGELLMDEDALIQDVKERFNATITTSNNLNLEAYEPVELTKGKRKEINSQVKELIKKDVKDITVEDKNILRQYTGQGGLGQGGYNSLTEHYTPYETVKAMYKAIGNIKGFTPKKALEPSVGSGNFVGFNPKLDWTTIDIDKTNHEVVKRLYPDAKHYEMSYEGYKGKDFDLVISNVPFLEDRGKGITKGRPDIKALHDYYFVESIDKVKDNGVVAFVTSTGVMDKVDSKIRKEIVSKADVIGAYRLPAKTFSKNAHTDVTTDIIFLQKRPDGVKSRIEQKNKSFTYSTKTDDDIGINQYYVENPSSILGDVKVGVNKMYGTKAYEVSGTPDYSNMKLDYKKYTEDGTNKDVKTNTKQEIPTDSKDFEAYTRDNDLDYSYDGDNIIIDQDGFRAVKETITFDDIDKTVKIYEPIKGAIRKKINALENIKQSMNVEAINKYQAEFKKHPLKSNDLKKFFREHDSMDKLYEYGALFDDKFKAADSFGTTTKHTNSGKLEITSKSKLHDRLLANENTQGIIDIPNAKHFDKSELVEALKLGYAYIDSNTIANDILYYAGNVYKKLDETNTNLDSLPAGEVKKLVEKQALKLNKILPAIKTVDEIDFKGVEKWIEEAEIKLFEYSIVDKEIKQAGGGTKKYKKIEAQGVGAIYNSYLNQDALIKAKEGESQTSYKRRLKEAQYQVKDVQAKLRNDIKNDSTLKDRFEEAYNRKMNFYVKPDYAKAQYLIQDVLDELPGNIKLRKNQIEWVIKALYEGKNINAHDVGGGKTMAGIVLARVLKTKGIAKKPLLVVPSKVIKNWEKEILELFPNSKIISLGGLPKNVREKRLFDLGNTNADYVLISQEGFKQLKLPGEVEQSYARALINENMRNEDLTGRAREMQQQKIDLYLDSLKKSNANKKITIDKLGIDAVIADEARAFKNVGVNSKLVANKLGKGFGLTMKLTKEGKFKSISLDSALAYDFRFKTKYISSLNNNKNIYLLDATPTPNKPIEVFTMLKHLDDNIFDEYGISTDRDFAETFFEFGQKLSKNGKMENGIIAIKNAVALRSILDRYVDRIPMKEFASRKLIKLPAETVKKEMISSSDESAAAFEDIRERLKAAKEDYTKRHEIMGIFSNGVTASVDPRLYARAEFGDLIDPTPDNNKVKRVVELVTEKFKTNKEAGQIIFLDSAGHSTLSENLHQEIKTDLLNNGYKKSQVAIINGQTVTNLDGVEIKASGEKASKMKQDIVNAYKDNKIKVVIGTTKSAGEGMNIQKYTTNIHHIDLPWTPAEIIQRNGRGIRHGNINPNVDIHYYFQEGTFDSLMYSVVMGKKGWNDAIWDADVKDRLEITDDSGAMPTEAEILIEMESNPVIKAEMIVRLDLEKLEMEHESVREELKFAKTKIITTEESIIRNNQLIKGAKDSLNNDTPTATLKLAYEKAYKKGPKQKEYKKKYADDLASFKERKLLYIQSLENKAPMYKDTLAKLKDGLKVYEDDFKAIDAQLKNFEDKHLDERGNIITSLDKGC